MPDRCKQISWRVQLSLTSTHDTWACVHTSTHMRTHNTPDRPLLAPPHIPPLLSCSAQTLSATSGTHVPGLSGPKPLCASAGLHVARAGISTPDRCRDRISEAFLIQNGLGSTEKVPNIIASRGAGICGRESPPAQKASFPTTMERGSGGTRGVPPLSPPPCRGGDEASDEEGDDTVAEEISRGEGRQGRKGSEGRKKGIRNGGKRRWRSEGKGGYV